MDEVWTVKIKLTEFELGKILWCIKSISSILGFLEISPDKKWDIKLDKIQKDMEEIYNSIQEEKEAMTTNKTVNPKKEYMKKISG